MKIETALRKQDKFKSRVNDILSKAEVYRFSHQGILDHLTEFIYSDPEYKKLPGWCKSYLHGYLDARMSELWNKLEDRWLLNGEYVTKDKITLWSEAGEYGKFWPKKYPNQDLRRYSSPLPETV